MPTYELWHIDTDEKVGFLETKRAVDETIGARVNVRLKRRMQTQGQTFDAIQVLVCKMEGKREACPECKGTKETQVTEDLKIPCPKCHATGQLPKSYYWALETNMPIKFLPNLEGFTANVVIPRLSQIFAFGRKFDK